MRLALIDADKKVSATAEINYNLSKFLDEANFASIVTYFPTLVGEIDFTQTLNDCEQKRAVYYVSPADREVSATPSLYTRSADGALARVPLTTVDYVNAVIVPGLAFDALGGRLGRGGGFYDRFLLLPQLVNALKVAVCFEDQLIEAVPLEPHDIRVDVVITEKRILRIKTQNS